MPVAGQEKERPRQSAAVRLLSLPDKSDPEPQKKTFINFFPQEVIFAAFHLWGEATTLIPPFLGDFLRLARTPMATERWGDRDQRRLQYICRVPPVPHPVPPRPSPLAHLLAIALFGGAAGRCWAQPGAAHPPPSGLPPSAAQRRLAPLRPPTSGAARHVQCPARPIRLQPAGRGVPRHCETLPFHSKPSGVQRLFRDRGCASQKGCRKEIIP